MTDVDNPREADVGSVCCSGLPSRTHNSPATADRTASLDVSLSNFLNAIHVNVRHLHNESTSYVVCSVWKSHNVSQQCLCLQFEFPVFSPKLTLNNNVFLFEISFMIKIRQNSSPAINTRQSIMW